jgi:hypothetical protein
MGFLFSRYSRTGRLEIDIPDEKDVVGAAVDSGLPRTTLWCPRPFHHDSGGADSGTPHRRQRLAATALSPCAWSSARVTGVTAASYGVSPGHSRGRPEWDARPAGRPASPFVRLRIRTGAAQAAVCARCRTTLVVRPSVSGFYWNPDRTRTLKVRRAPRLQPKCPSTMVGRQGLATILNMRALECSTRDCRRPTARMVERRPGNRPRA